MQRGGDYDGFRRRMMFAGGTRRRDNTCIFDDGLRGVIYAPSRAGKTRK